MSNNEVLVNDSFLFLEQDVDKDGKTLQSGEEYVNKYVFKVSKLLESGILEEGEIESVIEEKNSLFEDEGYTIKINKVVDSEEIEEIVYSKKEFNCIEPIRNDNGSLLARKLSKADDIENGYDSINELFHKLNSITDTQVEPLYEPYYHGEENEKGEKIPTYIIVGDIHADNYGLEDEGEDIEYIREMIFLTMGKHVLVESDEGAGPEISAVDILNSKFGIDIIGLENEFNKKSEKYKTKWFSSKRKNRTGIGKGVCDLGIDYIGLEDQGIIDATKVLMELGKFQKELKHTLFNKKNIGLLYYNLDLTADEFVELYQKHKDKIINDDFKHHMSAEPNPSGCREKINTTITEFSDYDVDTLIDIYSLSRYVSNHMMKALIKGNIVGKILYPIISILKNKFEKSSYESSTFRSIDKISDRIVYTSIKQHKVIIHNRNAEGIELVTEKMGEKQISAMVYGKAHIPNLMKQLKDKYDGKVNIYVAK